MRIAILGAGRMGSAIGLRWVAAGHAVTFSYSRDRGRLAMLTARGGTVAGVGEAVAGAEAILLSVPWVRLDDVLAQAGNLGGRVLIDCTLPMTADDSALAIGLTTSGGETVQSRTAARVVKAFNTVPAEYIAAPARIADRNQGRPSLFLAGDDTGAKALATGLIADAGFAPVDVGGLSMARYLEPFALLMGQLAYEHSATPEVGYRIVRSGEEQ